MSDRSKVDFMIVGAQKCGTTTLSDILNTHPSLVCCREKEPHFFSRALDWQAELPRYEQLFHRRAGARFFEASTSYTFYPHRNLDLWERLYAYNPALKIIYLVRDPIERVTSAYMHSYQRGYTDLPFERALVERAMLLNVTRYASQITPFIRRFGSERVRILFFEDLVRDPSTLVRNLAAFLEVDAHSFRGVNSTHSNKSLGRDRRHHKHDTRAMKMLRRVAPPLWRSMTDNSERAFSEKPVLSPSAQWMVLHMLRAEIDELEVLSGRDLDHWRRRPQTPKPHTSPFFAQSVQV
jgi:hypothetical protein